MGTQHFKQSITDALSGGDNREAAKLLVSWQVASKDALKDPMFYTAKAIIHLRNGSVEAANHNMKKALELMEK